MEQRLLGQSGISVSALSVGSWLTWEAMEESTALAVMTHALDQGITFLDDARYNDRTGRLPMKTGYSEVLFGRLLRQIGRRREDLVIANKLWFEFFPGESIEAELDGSLSRLEMDYLDIEYCAELPPTLPMRDLVRELTRLIVSGRLRAWGVLNWPVEKIEEAVQVAKEHGWLPPTAAQVGYSVLKRSPVEDRRPQELFERERIGIVASYSLSGGLLSGKYRSQGGSGGRLSGEAAAAQLNDLLPRVPAFLAIAEEVGCTPAQLALAYCLANPLVSSVVFGARSLAQLTDNLGALAVAPRLSDEVMARLRAV